MEAWKLNSKEFADVRGCPSHSSLKEQGPWRLRCFGGGVTCQGGNLVNSPAAVIIPEQPEQARRVDWWRAQSALTGRSWQQEIEGPGQVVLKILRAMNVCAHLTVSFFRSPGLKPGDSCCTLAVWIFLPQLI